MPKQNFLSAAFIVTALTSTRSVSPICQNSFDKMNKNIARITQKIDRLFSDDWLDTIQAQTTKAAPQACNGRSPQPKLLVDQEGDIVTIKLQPGKGITNIDANIKNDQISVEMPEKNQKIFIDYEKASNYLAITIGQSAQKKEEKNGTQRQSAFFNSMQHGQTLNQRIEFGKAKIDYKGDTLTISFPKIVIKKEKAPKKIPIDFIK